MKKNMAIVGIPIYKENLNEFECISLKQVLSVLARWDICFIAPEKLNLNCGIGEKSVRIERFSDRYFDSRSEYSELLTSVNFYQRFIEYDYILIYQLDAFVFHDTLEEFCMLGYDYIGAPIKRWKECWRDIPKHVGNGGLSLRKINKCLKLCKERERLFECKPKNWDKNYFTLYEDLFFGWAGGNPALDFRTPDYRTSMEFAVEMDCCHAYKRLKHGWIPFGCHAWYKISYGTWRPLIMRFGYSLPLQSPFKEDENIKTEYIVMQYCMNRMARFSNKKSLSVVLDELNLSEERKIAVWGCGRYGKQCMAILTKLGIHISVAIDRSSTEFKNDTAIDCCNPDINNINEQDLIIITTKKYEDEVKMILESNNKIEHKDFMTFNQLTTSMAKKYHKLVFG